MRPTQVMFLMLNLRQMAYFITENHLTAIIFFKFMKVVMEMVIMNIPEQPGTTLTKINTSGSSYFNGGNIGIGDAS